MSKFFILIMMFCGVQVCLAQTEVVRKNKITSQVTEKYNTVITADRQMKQGVYQAMYGKKVLLAQGKYADDKRVGLWRFFDKKQKLIQVFNYDTGKFIYEAPEDSTSSFKYEIEAKTTDSIIITKPLKQGGRYFGFLPYLRFFKMPQELQGYDPDDMNVVIELFITSMGQVAEFKMHFVAHYYKRTLSIDPGQLYPEDKTFKPATYNKEPISSHIFIVCQINKHGELDMNP
ncbi:hypothetical protein ACFQZS_04215 [Mucilaginibacter calamicampi]|uniref:MORN repeat variant n=1 Tax=Mucilaginibacter calamicampi TaxID=1302352 RepID=A0ABW2YUT7_9SPHI